LGFAPGVRAAVVHAPYGAHPAASPGVYGADEPHLKIYFDAVRKGETKSHLDTYVAPKTQAEYLDKVGLETLFALEENA